jgi:hypothetical protein
MYVYDMELLIHPLSIKAVARRKQNFNQPATLQLAFVTVTVRSYLYTLISFFVYALGHDAAQEIHLQA